MADLAFIVVIVAFFAVCAGYTRLCDRIIGPDEEALVEGGSGADGLTEEEAVLVLEATK
jgi:hypothetical protein